MAFRIKLIIVIRHGCHVHQATDAKFGQIHKGTKTGDTTDHASKALPHMTLHELNFKALIDITTGFLGTPLSKRTMPPETHHVSRSEGKLIFGSALRQMFDGAMQQ